jgi:hypothetical protein
MVRPPHLRAKPCQFRPKPTKFTGYPLVNTSVNVALQGAAMHTAEHPYAGLILPVGLYLDPTPYLETAARVLARLDPLPGAAPRHDPPGNRVIGRRFGVVVLPEEDSDYGPRVLIEITTAEGARPQDESAAKLLSDIVLESLDHSSADILEWYSPDVLLDREDFIRLRSYVSPKRLQEVDRAMEDDLFDAADLTESRNTPSEPEDDTAQQPAVTDRLSRYRITLQQPSPQERRLGVAGALMGGVVAIISFPFAAFVYTIVLIRGMDFRLMSQAVAVTALFAALYNADRLNGVLQRLIN